MRRVLTYASVCQEKEERKEREREKRRRRLRDINTLVEFGYSKRDASKALHHAKGDVDKAYGVKQQMCCFINVKSIRHTRHL